MLQNVFPQGIRRLGNKSRYRRRVANSLPNAALSNLCRLRLALNNDLHRKETTSLRVLSNNTSRNDGGRRGVKLQQGCLFCAFSSGLISTWENERSKGRLSLILCTEHAPTEMVYIPGTPYTNNEMLSFSLSFSLSLYLLLPLSKPLTRK